MKQLFRRYPFIATMLVVVIIGVVGWYAMPFVGMSQGADGKYYAKYRGFFKTWKFALRDRIGTSGVHTMGKYHFIWNLKGKTKGSLEIQNMRGTTVKYIEFDYPDSLKGLASGEADSEGGNVTARTGASLDTDNSQMGIDITPATGCGCNSGGCSCNN
jgi:hypothetical protein